MPHNTSVATKRTSRVPAATLSRAGQYGGVRRLLAGGRMISFCSDDEAAAEDGTPDTRGPLQPEIVATKLLGWTTNEEVCVRSEASTAPELMADFEMHFPG